MSLKPRCLRKYFYLREKFWILYNKELLGWWDQGGSYVSDVALIEKTLLRELLGNGHFWNQIEDGVQHYDGPRETGYDGW